MKVESVDTKEVKFLKDQVEQQLDNTRYQATVRAEAKRLKLMVLELEKVRDEERVAQGQVPLRELWNCPRGTEN